MSESRSLGGRTLLISGGGPIGQTPIQDHWSWDGDHWTQVTSALPFGVIRAAATYDAARQRVVLFGGEYQGKLMDELWEWDGQRWNQRTASGSWPAARSGHTLVYDAARRRAVLFGGRDASLFVRNDLWEWDGTSWTQITPVSPLPAPRMYHAMVYDQARRVLVLFGGNDSWRELGDMWLLRYDDPAVPDQVEPANAAGNAPVPAAAWVGPIRRVPR